MQLLVSSTKLKKLLMLLLITSAFMVKADNYALRELENWEKNIIKISNSSDIFHTFEVYIADSNSKRKKGLMYIENLPNNHGMLFKFNSPRIASMWMKNTYISLDLLFIDKNQTIVKIHNNAEPFNLKSISSKLKVKWVLEINGGLAEELGINPGNKIIF
ncbi:uncharacterized protein METZ01_LOCUS241827 [marine metagenome]|uniref:DUF192 domain-containing protein n=1 Tax=marine metagenome TaxID=408172 RepID=A0A382HQR2_9ZZZZ